MDYSWKRDIPLPDEIMRNFHPTELGTSMQASTALDYVALHKAKTDGTNNEDHADACDWTPPDLPKPPEDKLMCSDPNDPLSTDRWTTRNGYIAAVEQFCTDIDGTTTGAVKTYKDNTYDGTKFVLWAPGVPVGTTIAPMTKDKCMDKLGRVVDGCVPAPNNPMNWKYGGVFETADGWRFETSPWYVSL